MQAIPLLFIFSVVLFVLMQNIGDPLATLGGRTVTRAADRKRLTRQLGLDKPVAVQYLYWLVGNDWTKIDMDGDGIPETRGTRKGVLRGDFGTSLLNMGQPAMAVIGERLPNTLILMLTAEFVIIFGSLLIGIYSALRQYSLIDNLVTAISFIGYSMPIFFIALVSMYIFSVNFKRWGLPYLPTVGMFDPDVGETPGQVLLHMILPVFSIAFISFAAYSRYIRSTMLEVLSQDYIRTARSKGLTRRNIVFVHALKNASLPIVTVVGSGPAPAAGRRGGHRAHLCLARHGPPVPGWRIARRYPGGDGHLDDHRRGSGGLPDHHRYHLCLAGPTDPL